MQPKCNPIACFFDFEGIFRSVKTEIATQNTYIVKIVRFFQFQPPVFFYPQLENIY